MWDSWPVASFYLIQLPHDIRRDMGQIADAGDHHGIHELAFERIQEEFDPFGPPPTAATAAGLPMRTASAPRASILRMSSP